MVRRGVFVGNDDPDGTDRVATCAGDRLRPQAERRFDPIDAEADGFAALVGMDEQLVPVCVDECPILGGHAVTPVVAGHAAQQLHEVRVAGGDVPAGICLEGSDRQQAGECSECVHGCSGFLVLYSSSSGAGSSAGVESTMKGASSQIVPPRRGAGFSSIVVR